MLRICVCVGWVCCGKEQWNITNKVLFNCNWINMKRSWVLIQSPFSHPSILKRTFLVILFCFPWRVLLKIFRHPVPLIFLPLLFPLPFPPFSCYLICALLRTPYSWLGSLYDEWQMEWWYPNQLRLHQLHSWWHLLQSLLNSLWCCK